MSHVSLRPRMEKSQSCWPQTVWCVVNMFHKNGMRPLIIANGTKCYSIFCCNSPSLYIRLKYTYSVISVKLNSLPGNSKKWVIDMFVAFGVRLVHSWAACMQESCLPHAWTSHVSIMHRWIMSPSSMDDSYVNHACMTHVSLIHGWVMSPSCWMSGN